ncbi:hypothetical protein niasHT_039606 [Heterodera trifolii]|uniref:Thiamine diphosphokinase n=1 Tax=Heterodera trifolii TaxID=157864 RepID=A0ABD2HZP4_9BILA
MLSYSIVGALLLIFGVSNIATAETKERKFTLISDPEKLVVIFVNGPAGGTSDDLPEDWIHLWNEAALKVVLDGASNELIKMNKSGHVEMPDVIAGDLETISNDTKQYIKEANSAIQMAQIKDEHKTDLEKAIDVVGEKLRANSGKFSSGILLLGSLHGRLDLIICALHSMLAHVQKQPDIPIMALDDKNFMVIAPAGIIKMELSGIEFTGKSGIFPMGRPAKLSTKGFKWNLGANGDRENIQFGRKVSCCNNIQEHELLFNSTEPFLFTLELKKANDVLKN